MKSYKFTNKYLNRLAKNIDNILDSNNEIVLKNFVKNYSEIIEMIGNAYGFYLLGNAWNGIRKIKYEKIEENKKNIDNNLYVNMSLNVIK